MTDSGGHGDGGDASGAHIDGGPVSNHDVPSISIDVPALHLDGHHDVGLPTDGGEPSKRVRYTINLPSDVADQ